MAASPIRIVFALFPGVTQLDFTGPHQVLSRLPGAEVILASRAGGAIETDGITFAGLHRLADVEGCDIICVPGGFGVTDNAIADAEFLRELRRLADGARRDLTEGLGPEFGDFDIADLNPRTFVRKHLLDDEFEGDPVVPDDGTPYSTESPYSGVTLSPGESPPYDSEAT